MIWLIVLVAIVSWIVLDFVIKKERSVVALYQRENAKYKSQFKKQVNRENEKKGRDAEQHVDYIDVI